ncbi:hypothetical protein Lqui_1384 [Legionella quinlivanii]|uniref:Uncharacterized protein n=1 Tax=Legionella quinlivanii TaxID=45073 RepID=A0A0W0XZ93_9GAMM|nr:hypothetical protein [Legionella quinlivanii]KTD50059.1 hypothetical protein Lqui_1384 [Legionella quinlivanii]SEF93149.1 hypothetical protein SAMN02746093_01412 [Legionella quinlivanii DSM 21216]STY11165.1 Uncharacterised protein [Legionella quinlivanii]
MPRRPRRIKKLSSQGSIVDMTNFSTNNSEHLPESPITPSAQSSQSSNMDIENPSNNSTQLKPEPSLIKRFEEKIIQRATENRISPREQACNELNQANITPMSIEGLKEDGKFPRSKIEQFMLYTLWKMEKPVVKQPTAAEPTAESTSEKVAPTLNSLLTKMQL